LTFGYKHINAQAEAHPIPESNASLDPIAILSADSVSAFNAVGKSSAHCSKAMMP
jgi:hypothetical protein